MIRLDSISKEFYIRKGCRILHQDKAIILFFGNKPFLKYSLDRFDSDIPLNNFCCGYSATHTTIHEYIKNYMDYYPYSIQKIILEYFKYITHILKSIEKGLIK